MNDVTQIPGRLNGKTAIITGGTTGLGLASAKRFVEEGAKIIITGRSQDRVDTALIEIGDAASGFVADSTSLPDLEGLAIYAKETLGRVDILFANAGNGQFAPISDVDEALYAAQFDLNVKGVFFTVQKILPMMSAGGSIIMTASAVHSKGAPGGTLYFASKAAVRSLARTMSAELGAAGIRVNSLSPGIVPTQFFANSNVDDSMFAQFDEMAGKGSPAGRAGRPEEIAEAAVYLASGESSYVTAIDLSVDGGWSQV